MAASHLRQGLRLTAIGMALAVASISHSVAARPGNAVSDAGPPTGQFGASDPMFQQPYVDIDEWRDVPVRHHYIHGGFKGTEVKFAFFFPEKEAYQGRFFQHIAPVPGSENESALGTGENNRIKFAFDSGGYLVASNMGGFTAPADVSGFRASAAAADYSRVIALKLFGGKRPYGYAYGGSGGGYRTMAAIENTTVWDGAVPYVIGSPRAMQVMISGHSRASRVLRDKFPQIVDAIDAGGSGDMYAGLSPDQADALREVTRFGYPPRAWVLSMTPGALGPLPGPGGLPGTGVPAQYLQDFWIKPGFEGTDTSSFASRARIQFPTTAVKFLNAAELTAAGLAVPQPMNMAPAAAPRAPGQFVNPVGADLARAEGPAAEPAPQAVAVQLAAVPDKGDLLGAKLIVLSGAAADKTIPLVRIVGDVAVVSPGGFGMPGGGPILATMKPGDEVRIDNSDSLASEVFLRHQVPLRDYYTWDQYRDLHGSAVTPQFPLSPESSIAGTIQTGRFKAKVIVVASLMDELALPWNADWYRTKVRQNLGAGFNNQFRLWYTDNAIHGDSQRSNQPTRIVSYLGVLYQALRDVSAWVERGVAPPASTNYSMQDGQVVLAEDPARRGGIQPQITLRANGATRTMVKVGQAVTLTGMIDLPSHTGSVVEALWDFEGVGTFPTTGVVKQISPTRASISATHAFSKPGTYFAVLKATSQ